MAATRERSNKHDELERAEQMLDEQQLEEIFAWVDSVPLSRTKKEIHRDFSDGVLVAELVKHFFNNLVEMHNYTAANSENGKTQNWDVLNRKVFPKLNLLLAGEVIEGLVSSKPGCIEKLLVLLKAKIDRALYAKERRDRPEAEQHEVSPGRKGAHIKDTSKGGKFIKSKQENEIKNTDVKRNEIVPEVDNKNCATAARVEPHRHGRNKSHYVDSDSVPLIMLEEREQEVLAKDEMIQTLLAKIDRLEHLLKLKDMKIFEIQTTLQSRSEAQLDGQYNTTYKPNQKPRYYR